MGYKNVEKCRLRNFQCWKYQKFNDIPIFLKISIEVEITDLYLTWPIAKKLLHKRQYFLSPYLSRKQLWGNYRIKYTNIRSFMVSRGFFIIIHVKLSLLSYFTQAIFKSSGGYLWIGMKCLDIPHEASGIPILGIPASQGYCSKPSDFCYSSGNKYIVTTADEYDFN